MDPYRLASPPPASSPSDTRKLDYVPACRETRASRMAGTVYSLGLSTALGTTMAAVAHGALGVFLGVSAGAACFLAFPRTPQDVVRLRVRSGMLRVFPRGAKKAAFEASLEALLDISLETRIVERVIESGNVNVGGAYLNPRVAPPTSMHRILLETSGATFPLTVAFFGHADTLEWFGKIRLFLRNAGWTPRSEREYDER